MTIAVRPASRRSRPRSIVFSVAHVDVRGRLVEDQDARFGEQRAGEGDELALARRELDAALADLGLDPFGQRRDELGRADRRGRGFDLLQARLGPAEGDVLAHAAGEEEALLGDDPELAPQGVLLDPAQVVAVDRARGPRCGS